MGISGNIPKSSSGFSAKHNSKDANDIGAKYFENFKGNVFQRKYTIIVNQKAEDCYFVTELIPGRTFKVDFVVVNTGSSGEQLDIDFYIRDPKKNVVQYISRKSEGSMNRHHVQTEGDYKICFSNRHSTLQNKRISWKYEIEGLHKSQTQRDKLISDSINEYEEQAEATMTTLISIRNSVHKAWTSLWWLKSTKAKHHDRIENISSMISRRSLIHAAIVILVAIFQVLILRNFFNFKSPSTKMRTRA